MIFGLYVAAAVVCRRESQGMRATVLTMGPERQGGTLAFMWLSSRH